MSAMPSQITGVTIVGSNVCSSANQRKHQRSASLAFARRTHRWPTDDSLTQRASDAENVSIWWRHHDSWELKHTNEYPLPSFTVPYDFKASIALVLALLSAVRKSKSVSGHFLTCQYCNRWWSASSVTIKLSTINTQFQPQSGLTTVKHLIEVALQQAIKLLITQM